MTVQLQIRHSYGRERIYPVNWMAKQLCRLTGRLTFLRSDLEIINKLGFTIEWVPESVEVCNGTE